MLVLLCSSFSFILIGWGLLFARLLKTNLAIGLFNATAFCALASFFSFLIKIPGPTAWLVLGFGALFFIYFVTKAGLRPPSRETFNELIRTIACMLVLGAFGLFIAFGMKFRSIDDYSFWGAMSKYLFVFGELPKNDQYISSSYLSYTPLVASFHYLLFTLGQGYSQCLGFFAQTLFLVAAMMVFFEANSWRKSIALMSLWYILLSLAYGLAFARMEVDACVASYFFAVSWLIYKKGDESIKLIFMPTLALSLIKEIGLLFALEAIILYLLLSKPRFVQWIQSLALFFCTVLGKLIWKWHVISHGFHSFSKAVTWQAAWSSLNPFNPYYHQAQWLYLKEMSLANFDHLIKLPYTLLYLMLFGLFYWTLNRGYPETLRLKKLMGIFFIFALIYLVLLYHLQAIVFQVGHELHEILDFPRYYNMLFLPWFSLMVLISFDQKRPQAIESYAKSMAMLLIALSLMVGGKIERTRKFYQPLDKVQRLIAAKAPLQFNKTWTLCLHNPPQPLYEILMPLTYFLMPHRVIDATKKTKPCCDLHLSFVNNRTTAFIEREKML